MGLKYIFKVGLIIAGLLILSILVFGATIDSIVLNSPDNETITNDNTPDFNFTVTGNQSSYSCELFINDIGYGVSSWDLSSYSYDNINISTQVDQPTGLFFKPDGNRFYINELDSNKMYQYSCSDPWNLNSYSYDNINISTQDDNPFDLVFKPDGTKLYELGNIGDKIYQYSCSTPWNLSSCSYDSIFFSVDDTFATGLFFKPDGTEIYIIGTGGIGVGGDTIWQYSCSNAWNLSSCSYASWISAQDSLPQGLFFKPDGTKLYETGNIGDKIYQYSCSNAWTLSSCSYDSIYISTQDDNPRDLFFKPDGTKLYEIGYTGDKIYQYSFFVPNNTPTVFTANSTLSDGTYNWYINCTANGTTNQSEIRQITIDTQNPLISITYPTSNSAKNNYIINGTSTDTNLNYTNISIKQGATIINSTTTTNSTWSVNLYAPDGVYNITATAYDNATNSNSTTITNITIDTTLSVTLNTTASDENSIINRTWSYQEAYSTENLNGSKLEWNGTNETATVSGMNCYLNKTGLADGNYTYKFYVNDSVGNWNSTDTYWTYVDTTQPQQIGITSYPTGLIISFCGNGICETDENNTLHSKYCPQDCGEEKITIRREQVPVVIMIIFVFVFVWLFLSTLDKINNKSKKRTNRRSF